MRTELDQCEFGPLCQDEQGKAPAKKPTSLLTNSREVDRAGIDTCILSRAEPRLRRYTLEILRSASAMTSRHRSGLRITPREVMRVETMRQAAKTNQDECPAAALHETGCEGMEAYDDISGQPLDPALMIKARQDEIEYFRSIAWTRRSTCRSAGTSAAKPPSRIAG